MYSFREKVDFLLGNILGYHLQHGASHWKDSKSITLFLTQVKHVIHGLKRYKLKTNMNGYKSPYKRSPNKLTLVEHLCV